MKPIARTVVLWGLVGGLSQGCLPKFLNKYQNGGTDPGPQQRSSRSAGTTSRGDTSGQKAESGPDGSATIYAVGERTFRFRQPRENVWDGALDVLMQDYNLNIIDRDNGVVTTEWDSYYLDGAVYRNKISLRLSRRGWKAAELRIHNNVERLQDASQAAGAVGAVWLPAEDRAGEVARLIQNMALVLNQPPPLLPPGVAVAEDRTKATGSTESAR